MRCALLILVCLLASPQAPGQEVSDTVTFAVYHLSGGDRRLLAEGQRDYTAGDLDVVPWGSPTDGYQNHRKTLKLHGGFSIGTVVTRRDAASGFGLWVQDHHHPAGFSWEWFNHEDGDIYKKGEGEGRVRVTHAQIAHGLEMRSVEFLTDITLRFNDLVDPNLAPGATTHEVVVSKGSVFRVAL